MGLCLWSEQVLILRVESQSGLGSLSRDHRDRQQNLHKGHHEDTEELAARIRIRILQNQIIPSESN